MDGSNKTNLIVNYLPQSLTDEEFRTMFASVAPVKNSKIVRDRATNYSYGFGFVDYHNQEDAENAIQRLNGLQIQNKKIKVAFSRPGGDSIKGANLYVRNWPKDKGQEEIAEVFGGYGNIIQTRLLRDQYTGASKGVAFILYDQKAEAQAALSALHGKLLPGCSEALNIKFADDNRGKARPPAGGMGQGGGGSSNGGGGGFGGGYSGGYGQGRGGYGASGYSGGPMRNQGNRFRYNPMSGGYSGGNNSGMGGVGNEGYILFVYNIGPDAEERTLWQLFTPFGTVQKVNVIRDHGKDQCKGYGFVTMVNYQEALNAIQGLDGYWYNDKTLQVSFKTPK